MTELSLTVVAVSPVALHRDRASSQFAPTLDYIPGSTVRGALAEAYLAVNTHSATDAAFKALFLDDSVLYPDLVPGDPGGAPWHLVPATAWACKRYRAKHNESVTDNLLRQELTETLREASRADWRRPLEAVADCPTCSGPAHNRPRDRLRSSYAAMVAPIFAEGRVRERLLTGTAVDRATGAVASGMLFSRQVIAAQTTFSGRLIFADDSAESLMEQLQALVPTGSHLYVGYARSRGYGHIKVTDWDTPVDEAEPIAERWERFNQLVRRLWARYDAETPAELCFTLTLQSHLALHSPCGQPILGDITPADLGLPWARWGRVALDAVPVAGWNSAWGLPKADTWALRRGSVFLGWVKPEQKEATLARLAHLETWSAGDRRAEGMGRLRVCDEFHTFFTLQELIQEETR